MKNTTQTTFIPFIKLIREGTLLPGGVKQWQGAPQPTRDDAKALLAAFSDGHEANVLISGTREVPIIGPAEISKAIKAEIRELRAQMKRRGIRVISCFNGGLSADELRFNSQLFALKTKLSAAENA